MAPIAWLIGRTRPGLARPASAAAAAYSFTHAPVVFHDSCGGTLLKCVAPNGHEMCIDTIR